MTLSVGILGAGGMGAAIGARLSANGALVRTSLAGRSAATVERATRAGMADASLGDVAACDIVLAVLPPDQALPAARQLAPLLAQQSAKPVYVDLNAISPATAHDIAAVLAPSDTDFVDGSIIGFPPGSPNRQEPTLYLSGDAAGRVEALREFGLILRTIEGGIGAASALKMCYGAIIKGQIALGAAMLLAASRHGIADALHAEFVHSQPQLLAGYTRSIPDMLPKAHRWVPEMTEIAGFLGEGRPEGQVYAAIAEFYRLLADDQAAAGSQARALTSFLDKPTEPKRSS